MVRTKMVSTDEVEINSLLKIWNNGVLPQFLHDCIDALLGRLANFENYSSEIECTKEDCEKTSRVIQNCCREWIKRENSEIIYPSLSNKEIENVITECFRIRRDEIFQAVIKQHYLETGTKNLVENFDWKIKWIMGSSKLAALRQPVVQMDFQCSQKDDARDVVKRTHLNVEATVEQFNKLYLELERVKKEINSDTH